MFEAKKLITSFHFRTLVQYCYMRIIREELEEVKFAWNHHRIRKQKSGDIVPGIPELLYNVPEILGQFTCIDSGITYTEIKLRLTY